jgi:hypothetical protein
MATVTGTKVITAHIPLLLAQRVDAMAEQFERSRGWADGLSGQTVDHQAAR